MFCAKVYILAVSNDIYFGRKRIGIAGCRPNNLVTVCRIAVKATFSPEAW